MSTRATVWIKDEDTGEDKFLYHHCDGDDLDTELADVLTGLPACDWNIERISRAIVDYDDAYGTHKVDEIGWDSEYVYVISIKKKTLYKYECGLWFAGNHTNDNMSVAEEKTQEKYLIRELEFGPKGGVAAETLRFDDFQDKVHERAEKVREFATRMKSIIDDIGEVYGLTKEEIVMAGGLICGMYMKDGDNRVQ